MVLELFSSSTRSRYSFSVYLFYLIVQLWISIQSHFRPFNSSVIDETEHPYFFFLSLFLVIPRYTHKLVDALSKQCDICRLTDPVSTPENLLPLWMYMNMQISKFSLLSHGNAWRAIKRSMCCVLDRLMNGYGMAMAMLCMYVVQWNVVMNMKSGRRNRSGSGWWLRCGMYGGIQHNCYGV